MESLILAYAKEMEHYWAEGYEITSIELRGETFDVNLRSECGYYTETARINVTELLGFMWSRIGGAK